MELSVARFQPMWNSAKTSTTFGFLAERYDVGELEMVKRDSFQVYQPLKSKLSALRQEEKAGETVSVCVIWNMPILDCIV